jgi:ABC-type nickel/cobalt efflux system permease component RcnA
VTRRLLALLAILAALAAPASALAHPLGNFTVNRYARVELHPAEVRVRYVVDMAEIPTFQEKAALEQGRDRYVAERAAQLGRGLEVWLDGQPLPLGLRSAELDLPPGQGGLPTLRLALWLAGPLPEGPSELRFRDANFAERIGWRETVVRAAEGVRIVESNAPSEDRSNELRDYPADLLDRPLDVGEARATFRPDGGAVGFGDGAGGLGGLIGGRLLGRGGVGQPDAAGATPGGAGRPLRADAAELAGMVAAGELGGGAVGLALLVAALWGAGHALAPGHGKTIVAAYLVGSRGTARHALYLGLTVTATHTLGIYALGLTTLFAASAILPERLYPWLSLGSGLAVVLVGASLLVARLRGRHAHGHHEHGHHEHSHHEHSHHEHDQHEHGPARHDEAARAGRAGGHEPRAHDHDHRDGHRHGHEHGGHHHEHRPPERVTPRSLIALGIAGGLLPCPSALVLLLGAIALGQIAFGLLLVVAFSLGLAGVLTAIGIALVHARRLLETPRLSRLPRGALLRWAPVLSALVVTAIGALMSVQALAGIV